MAFTDSDFDLVAPLAARGVLSDWRSGETLDETRLAQSASLSPAQHAALVDSLVRTKLAERGGTGLRRTSLALRLFVADLGGTKLHAAIVDETGAVLAERYEPTAAGVRAVIDQMARLRHDLAAACAIPVATIGAAAIGVPGAVHPRTGLVSFAPNIAGLDGCDLRAELQQVFGHPVRLENDVNLAALGESASGCANGLRNFAFVALGTGIGMGLVLDGRLARGHRGMAGEIALLPAGAVGKDRLGAKGIATESRSVLEREIGSVGILDAAHRAGTVQAQTVEQLFAEARSGSAAACAAIAATGSVLFEALLAISAVIDPELIVLGGSIGLQPEIADQVAAQAKSHPFAPAVRTSTLGPYAVLAGASLAALSALLSPAFAPEPSRSHGD